MTLNCIWFWNSKKDMGNVKNLFITITLGFTQIRRNSTIMGQKDVVFTLYFF